MKLGPYELNRIYTGDARKLAEQIPDESVDLVFTDPPYPRKYLPLYGWLAETAARVLKPGGLCLAMAGHSYLDEIYPMMSKCLTYHWTFCIDSLSGQSATIWPRKINSFWKPVLSYSKGQYDGPWMGDNTRSMQNDKRFHKWGQSEGVALWFLSRFHPGVIWEPFTGGGSTLAVAKYLRIPYLAFEIDPDTAALARERVRNTQPPLLVPQAEQVEMAL